MSSKHQNNNHPTRLGTKSHQPTKNASPHSQEHQRKQRCSYQHQPQQPCTQDPSRQRPPAPHPAPQRKTTQRSRSRSLHSTACPSNTRELQTKSRRLRRHRERDLPAAVKISLGCYQHLQQHCASRRSREADFRRSQACVRRDDWADGE